MKGSSFTFLENRHYLITLWRRVRSFFTRKSVPILHREGYTFCMEKMAYFILRRVIILQRRRGPGFTQRKDAHLAWRRGAQFYIEEMDSLSRRRGHMFTRRSEACFTS